MGRYCFHRCVSVDTGGGGGYLSPRFFPTSFPEGTWSWFKEQSPSKRAGSLQTKVRGESHKDQGPVGPRSLWHLPCPRSETRPCPMYEVDVPILTRPKWSCHLKAPSHQLTDHLIQYWHCNCHLKALKRGAFLFTCHPWHLPATMWPVWVEPTQSVAREAIAYRWAGWANKDQGGWSHKDSRNSTWVCEVSWLTCKQKGSSLCCL